MLEARPKSKFSSSFEVHEGSRSVGSFDFAWVRERGRIVVDGQTFEATRKGMLRGAFVLTHQGEIVARAIKPSVWKRGLETEHDDQKYRLVAALTVRREYVLQSDGRKLGSIRPKSVWSRTAHAALPEDIHPAVRVFMIWLSLLLWRRRHRRHNSNSSYY